MAEYSKERLYYLKLPKEFFNSYQVKILEGMPNGKEYLLMYLKLMCESISHNGYLRFSKSIPYTPEMIANITNTNADIVRCGLKVMEELEMIAVTEDQSLYIPKVEEMTSSTTMGAERKRIQRTQGGQTGDKCPPEIDIELEKDIYIDKESDKDREIYLDKETITIDDDIETAKRQMMEFIEKKKKSLKGE